MDSFFKLLNREESPLVFNPWVDSDPENDVDRTAPKKRLSNLKAYLNERTNAEYLLLAEALGYQGGHFTGIPMTSERIIQGHKVDQGILPHHVSKATLHRTSNQKKHMDGFNEPTATIVWGKLIDENLDTRNFVFWNAFPWHPYKNSKNILSNRTPNTSELKEGEAVLKALVQSFTFRKIIALGNKAESILKKMDIKAEKVRHPAMGGAELFREQFLKTIRHNQNG
ncbi:uracil-DNA glycosylase [Desulfospira joergensenii]|uniref:uracil-DNA glycosylase n=1 Tax=Desulfospira joergensenii TaxID=53329 RepID=UPI0003B6A75A|nr:uracil-DNA glycosylase [Desulfospira joergensenii]